MRLKDFLKTLSAGVNISVEINSNLYDFKLNKVYYIGSVYNFSINSTEEIENSEVIEVIVVGEDEIIIVLKEA